MTDDEIDAAIRAAVPEACFAPNAAARAIYLAGYRAGIEAAGRLVQRIDDLSTGDEFAD